MSNVRSSGTNVSASEKCWLPVPRRPSTFHVSSMSVCPASTSIASVAGLPSGRCSGTPSRTTTQLPNRRSQRWHPLANGQRPCTR